MELVVHSYTWRVMLYRWLPSSDTYQMRVSEAADTCGSVRNAGKLHGALRDWKHKGNATGFWGKVWL